MPDVVTFSFNDQTLPARPGQSLASALMDAGVRVFRATSKNSPRGIFCGMGVCQDCLLTVDGKPNQRACMTAVTQGSMVQDQNPRPPLESPGRFAFEAKSCADQIVPAPLEYAPDVLVVGAGAGGLTAAATAARAGAAVHVLDERKVAGGQYFKQPATGAPLLDQQQEDGAVLYADAKRSGARLYRSVDVWGVFPGPLVYATSEEGAPLIFRPRQLIVATGAYERPQLVPGWTLPGVMTTGAAQTLWRSYRSLPGKRVAVCGSGPLNLQVALELAKAGVQVALVAESANSPWRHPWAALALVSAGPRLAAKGLAILGGLRKRRVPVRYGTSLLDIKARAQDQGLRVRFRCGKKTETLDVDAVCMNDGFEPQNEILRLLGAELRFDAQFGHFRCVRSASLQTSVSNVYAIGDCCGLGGAPAAAAEGHIAGSAAAAACGFYNAGADPQAERRLRDARVFQQRLWALHNPEPRSLGAVPDETIICRCEEVTLGQFRESLAQGASHIGVAKLATRMGMGCCQGRYCGPVAARLLAETRGQPVADHSYFAPRVPIKPVSVAALQATREAVGDVAESP